jgi:zinc transport system substrate-binding protein
MTPTRRDVLGAGASLTVAGGLSGCLDLVGLGSESIDADGYAIFFALHDWAEAVGGSEMSFENPVGTGKLGHGWSPDADITPDVAATGMFIYLDTPEFEWAQRLASNLERDHDDVVTVDLLEGLDRYLISPDHGGHDDGFHDPHVWLDPVIVQEMVDTLSAAFAEVDPDNAGTYEENARAYKERIRSIHEEFGTVVDEAALDTAILAGHDSFTYIERRYGFELQTPVGVSPNASASRDDIQRLIDTVDENGIDTVLYDPFEATAGEYPRLVDAILEESDAEHAEPLTPVSGTTAEWKENGWGWVEQMRSVNIASLEAALNPST